MKINPMIIFTFICMPLSSYAFFCPNNFNQINYGDTIATVQTQCGKPDKQETKNSKPEGPQEWSYFIPERFLWV